MGTHHSTESSFCCNKLIVMGSLGEPEVCLHNKQSYTQSSVYTVDSGCYLRCSITPRGVGWDEVFTQYSFLSHDIMYLCYVLGVKHCLYQMDVLQDIMLTYISSRMIPSTMYKQWWARTILK